MSSRRFLLGGIATSAVVLAAASLAWACVPQGGFTLNPTEGAAGSRVAASGSGFEAGQPVEIRWESRTGPILATTTGPAFNNVPITIPADAAPGVHFISAANTGEHGDHSATAASFEVTAAAQEPPVTPTPQPAPAAPAPAPTPPPAPSTPNDPPQQGTKRGTSPRAAALKRCTRKYSVKRVKSASKRKRLVKKRKACVRKAKRLSTRNRASAFNFASLPLFADTTAVRE